MSYIGKSPVVGNFQVCDAISTVNNQAAYTMQVGSANVSPESANHMIVSLNGVIQKPNSSYTVSGAVITFSSALVTGDVINFIQLLGDVLDIGTPSDGSVTSGKLASNSVTTAKITDANVTTAKVANSAINNAKTNFVSTSSAAGLQIKGDGTTDGTLQLNCSQNSHGIKFASPAHSSQQSYTLKFPTGNVTADKFLKVASVSGSGTSGIGQLSFADAGGGSLVKLSATTFGTAAAAVVFNNSLITSTYDNYKIFISGLASAGDQGGLAILMSVNNGSSFATHVGSINYTQINTGSSDVTGAAGNKAFIPLGSDDESDSTGSTNFEVTIYNVHDTSSYKFASGLGTVKNANGNYYGYRIHGYIASNTAVNYIKVYSAGGQNLDKGTVTLYGIAK
jgi:hypothetical protein